MTMDNFISEVAECADAPKCVTEKILRQAFALLKTFPDTGESLMVMNFGRFYAFTSSARKGRNPRTGEPMNILSSTKLAFKASKSA